MYRLISWAILHFWSNVFFPGQDRWSWPGIPYLSHDTIWLVRWAEVSKWHSNHDKTQHWHSYNQSGSVMSLTLRQYKTHAVSWSDRIEKLTPKYIWHWSKVSTLAPYIVFHHWLPARYKTHSAHFASKWTWILILSFLPVSTIHPAEPQVMQGMQVGLFSCGTRSYHWNNNGRKPSLLPIPRSPPTHRCMFKTENV